MDTSEQWVLVDMEKERLCGHKWIFGPFTPEGSSKHSKSIEIGYISLQEAEKTDQLHFHVNSEEYYLLLSGHMEIKVNKSIVKVAQGELLLVRPHVPHIILKVEPGTRILLIKAPPSQNDKIIIVNQE